MLELPYAVPPPRLERAPGLGDQPRVLADVRRRRRTRPRRSVRREGIRGRHQLHRYRERLRARRRGVVPRRGARGTSPRLIRPRDQALLADERRQRALAPTGLQAARAVPAPAEDGLPRPVSMPP